VFDLLRQNIAVWRTSRTLAEQFGEIVRAHAGYHRELRETQVRCKVVADLVKHAVEPMTGQPAPIVDWRVLPNCVPIQQINGQRVR
jgi:hypothetical protein